MKSKDYIDNFYKDFEGLEINGSSDCESFFGQDSRMFDSMSVKRKKIDVYW